ncbi:TPA: hypothetical protein RUY31_005449 [Klebsiella quasipneumoniae subsp. similipneumoniae]|nr:hypothetical protein [Klebsiella quasipneumoniae subsp. similipneumoniae]
MTGKMVEVTCKCCPDKFLARASDRKRGWAQFCSKSCAAFWKSHGRRRGHQSTEMRESAKARNDIERLLRERKSKHGKESKTEFVYIGGFGPWDDHKDC